MAKAKRRANGEGSITKRKDGKWMAKIKVGVKEDGKIKYKYFYADTQKEVIRKLEEFKISLNIGMEVEKGEIALSEWLNAWMEKYKKGLKPTTKISYETNIRVHINSYIGGVKLNELQTSQIQHMVNTIYDEGRNSISLVEKVMNVLNGALEQAIRNKMIKENPCKDVVYPANNKKERKAYTKEEQKMFEDALEGEKNKVNKVLFMTYLYTGARLGELPALTWKDINFNERYIDINKKVVILHDYNSKTKKTQQEVQDFCKTKSSKRKIYITDKLVCLLEEHKQEQIKECKALGLKWNENHIVFPSQANTILYTRNIQIRFGRIRNKAGISHGTMHTLRHSYATRCFEAGVDIKVISQQLGHKNVKITYDIYVHLMPIKQLEEIDKLNNIDFI